MITRNTYPTAVQDVNINGMWRGIAGLKGKWNYTNVVRTGYEYATQAEAHAAALALYRSTYGA